jgi:hypothetical protein
MLLFCFNQFAGGLFRRSFSEGGFLPAEDCVGLFGGFGRPFTLRLQLQQVIFLPDTDYRSALRVSVAAHKRAFSALPDDQLTFPAFITF